MTVSHLVDGDPCMDGGALGQSLYGDGEIACRETREQDEWAAAHAKGRMGSSACRGELWGGPLAQLSLTFILPDELFK